MALRFAKWIFLSSASDGSAMCPTSQNFQRAKAQKCSMERSYIPWSMQPWISREQLNSSKGKEQLWLDSRNMPWTSLWSAQQQMVWDRFRFQILVTFLVYFHTKQTEIYRWLKTFVGEEHPCRVLYKTEHWTVPDFQPWGVHLALLYLNRFSELLIHKPGEGFLLSLLATILSPVV